MPRRAEWLIAAFLILLAGGGAVWTFVYKHRAAVDRDANLYIPKNSALTPEAALLQQYIRIKTLDGDEVDGARFLAAQLAEAGIHAEIIESAPRRANVYARIKGRSAGNGLLLLNHIDVVPANGRWTRPPFAGSVVLNQIYGRGTIDMKGTAICQLAAMRNIARSGRVPERDIIFLAVADEENGGTLGTQWLLDHRPDVFEGVRYALNEGGITEIYREAMTYFGIETGSKQSVEVEVVAPAREPLRALRIALEPYFRPRDAARVLPGVRQYFASIAPTRRQNRDYLSNIDSVIGAGKLWLLPETYSELLMNTMYVTGPRRTADGRWSMRVVMRNLPDEKPEERLAWVAAAAKPFGASLGQALRRQGPAPISGEDTPLFRLIADEAKREFHAPAGPEVLIYSTTDSRFLRARGIVCYGVQAFPVDYSQSLSIHGPEERVRIDWFAEGVALTRRIVTRAAFERW
jgi:acetylornithine deacetylase/succinyl-diaminopimelate desuccinylase-like protein